MDVQGPSDDWRKNYMPARATRLEPEWQTSYGDWVAGMATWTHFVTLTHDPRRLAALGSATWSRVGISRHRKLVKRYFHSSIRSLDPGARWWSEMELHKSGQPHEHALLAVSSDLAPVLSMRQAWYDDAGWMDVQPIRQARSVAAYVAKYGGKHGAWAPSIWGFGLHDASTFSTVIPAMVAR